MQAKWYVYELIDPRDNSVFYVGKGSNKRMHEHEKEAAKQVCSDKCNRINEIDKFGLSILKRKVASFWNEKAAYEHEADRILNYGYNLTNVWMPAVRKEKDVNIDIESYVGRVIYWALNRHKYEITGYTKVIDKILPFGVDLAFQIDSDRTKKAFQSYGFNYGG